MSDLEKQLNKDDQVQLLVDYVIENNGRELENVRSQILLDHPDRTYILGEFTNVHGTQTGGFYVSPEMLFDLSVWPAIINRLQASVDHNRRTAYAQPQTPLPDEEFGGPKKGETIH